MLDVRLYVVTDEMLAHPRGVVAVVRDALSGGATTIQLRDKLASTRAMIDRARDLLAICAPHRVPLIINDRVDVAMAAGADGVHLGHDDMALRDARRLLGPHAIIGVSVRRPEEAREAEADGATYVAANGVWATPTKTDFGQPLGLDGVRELVRATRLPVVAIGGITVSNVGQVCATGCAGIAVVSAVMRAPDPTDACRQLRDRIGGG